MCYLFDHMGIAVHVHTDGRFTATLNSEFLEAASAAAIQTAIEQVLASPNSIQPFFTYDQLEKVRVIAFKDEHASPDFSRAQFELSNNSLKSQIVRPTVADQKAIDALIEKYKTLLDESQSLAVQAEKKRREAFKRIKECEIVTAAEMLAEKKGKKR